ncbi:hypothetical protein [Methylobacterium oxalidis]|uniref:hypothetical protein n=1 Tax=Methylobacterium oxalidis TaxID=944322 RepID=UPI0033147740
MPKVLKVETGAFAVVEDGVWWPGVYDTFTAAERATVFREADLSRLQERKNAESVSRRGIITIADLEALSNRFA